MRGALRSAALAAACALLTAPTAAQGAWPAEPIQQDHVQAVRTERTALFFRAWAEAGAGQRAQAAALLAELAGRGAPAGRRPELAHLALATRVLAGADPGAACADRLQRFVDAVDLQVAPGAFHPAAEGRGEPLRVRASLLEPQTLREEVEVGLVWVAPDGREIRARTERAATAAFAFPGFLLHLRAPLSEPGVWWLHPEVEWDGRTERGPGVPVECIADFGARLARLRAAAGESALQGGAELLLRRLELLAQKGLRSHPGAPPSRWLAHLEGEEVALAVPLDGPSADEGRKRAWSFVPASAPADRDVLVFLAPTGEAAESVFAGPLGESWRAAAAERGWELVGVEGGGRAGPLFVDTLRALAAREGSGRLVVVARGDAVTRLHLLLLGAGAPFDAAVLVGPQAAAGPLLGGTRVWVVDERAVPAGDPETAPPTETLALLFEPELPDRVARLLAAPAAEGD